MFSPTKAHRVKINPRLMPVTPLAANNNTGLHFMNKIQLYEAMGGRISMSSIGEYSDDIVILGKFGIVSWMDDYWDIWITGVHRDKELSSNKVKHLAKALGPLAKSVDTKLYCEAIAVVTGNEEAYLCAVLLGARKRRVDTPETLTKNRMRLSKLREATWTLNQLNHNTSMGSTSCSNIHN